MVLKHLLGGTNIFSMFSLELKTTHTPTSQKPLTPQIYLTRQEGSGTADTLTVNILNL